MLDLRVGRGWVLALTALTAVATVTPAAAQETDEARRELERARQERVRITTKGQNFGVYSSFGLYSHRGRLGVSITSGDDARDYAGALITDVTEDGPADNAGIRDGDIITAINGQSLAAALPNRSDERDLDLDRSVPVQRLMVLLRDVEPGDEVAVTYERDGDETTTTVVAEEMDSWSGVWGRGNSRVNDFNFDFGDLGDMQFRVAPQVDRIREIVGVWGFSGFGSSGLELAALNPELGSYFGAEEGVLVLDIDEDSTLGLEPGDVLLDIDGREVRDRDHVRRILGSYEPGEAVSFGVIRQGNEETAQGHMPDHRRRHRRGGLRN